MVDTRVGTECNSGTRKLKGDVNLKIDGSEIEMVPFVKNLLINNVLAIAKELEGYSEGTKIEIIIE
jgi:hypothetical protein